MVQTNHQPWFVTTFLVFFLISHRSLCMANVEERIVALDNQVEELKAEVIELTQYVQDLEKIMKENFAEQKLGKAIANILVNNQDKATMYWSSLTNFTNSPNELNKHLRMLVENTYLGNSKNFYYLMEFLTRNKLYVGYALLLQDLEEHGELYSGQEIFALAHQIKVICGTGNQIYDQMPKVVKDVLAGPFLLRNVDNHGFVLASENSTQGCDSRQTCYGSPRSQVFVYRLPMGSTVEELKNNSKAVWRLVAPSNISELSMGFYLKNMEEDLYLIFKQRLTATILRNYTVFDPYYAKDMHVQFLPTLIPNASPDEENLMRIGIRENFFGKIEYFYSGEFSKVNKLDFGRRGIYQDNLKGHVWEVIPENEDKLVNTIDTGESGTKCFNRM